MDLVITTHLIDAHMYWLLLFFRRRRSIIYYIIDERIGSRSLECVRGGDGGGRGDERSLGACPEWMSL